MDAIGASFPKLMAWDHETINKLLNSYISNIKNDNKNQEELLNDLEELQWLLERHMLLEEKEIFTVVSPESSKESEILDNLLDEHKQILDYLNKIKQKTDFKSSCINLKRFMFEHEKKEQEFFYPRLQILLDDQQLRELEKRMHTRF